MKENISIVIEITESQIKLFQQSSFRGKRLLSCCDIAPLTDGSDQEIIKFLKRSKILKEAHSDEVALVLPRKSVILKQLRLPTQNEEELKKMLSLQLSSQIPYSIEDVIFDYAILEKDTSGYTQVLVTVIHREVSARYLKCFAKAKISVNRIVISSWGILGWLSYQFRQATSIQKTNSIIINMTTCHTEVCFCANQKLYFSRSLNFGARNVKGEEFSFLLKQLKLSLEAYKKDKMGPPIGNIFLISSHIAVPALQKLLKKELKLPVENFSSFEGVMCAKGTSLAPLTKQKGASFAVCFGFLFSDAWKTGNLIPKEVFKIKDQKILDFERIKFVILVLLGCFLISTVFRIERDAHKDFSEQMRQKVLKIRPEINRIREQEEIVSQLSEVVEKRFYIPEIIYSIHQIVPEGLMLNSLHIDKEGAVTIVGDALSSALVQEFQELLVKKEEFADVRLQFATKRKLYRKEVTNYKIVLKVYHKHANNRVKNP